MSKFTALEKLLSKAGKVDDLGLYSKLERVIAEKMGGSASPEQILGMIKEVKPEEIQYTGLKEFLEGKDKVSKEDLLTPEMKKKIKEEGSPLYKMLGVTGVGAAATGGKEAQAGELNIPDSVFHSDMPSPGQVAGKVGEATLEGLHKLDQYTGQPARAALLATMNAKNPIKAAMESAGSDKDTTGNEVAHRFLDILEKTPGASPLRAPGMKEFPLEKPLGLAVETLADPVEALPFAGIAAIMGKKAAKAAKAAPNAMSMDSQAGRQMIKGWGDDVELEKQLAITKEINPTVHKVKTSASMPQKDYEEVIRSVGKVEGADLGGQAEVNAYRNYITNSTEPTKDIPLPDSADEDSLELLRSYLPGR